MAGYSKKSLLEKLGIKPGFHILIINPPEHYDLLLGPLPADVNNDPVSDAPLNFIQLFTKNLQELNQEFPVLKKHLKPDGMLWISWPKGTSSLNTDLNENLVREIGLKNGLVDHLLFIGEQQGGLDLNDSREVFIPFFKSFLNQFPLVKFVIDVGIQAGNFNCLACNHGNLVCEFDFLLGEFSLCFRN